MKIYAIGYERIEEKTYFYIYTYRFFSERKQVDEDFYLKCKPVFNIAHKNNNSLTGIYFDSSL